MQLSVHADYSCRVLMFLALKDKQKSSIEEIAVAYNISINHLVKIVHRLGQVGLIETVRGRNGGLYLAKDPRDINLGKVVKTMEPSFNMVECFNDETNHCVIGASCRLKKIFHTALLGFFEVLEQYSLADLITNESNLRRELGIATN